MSEIAGIQDAIRKQHGCESKLLGSIAVTERFQGKTVWDGTVEVFSVTGHPNAARCCAWSCKDDRGGERIVAVLGIPPVISPQSAVRVAIAADEQKKKTLL